MNRFFWRHVDKGPDCWEWQGALNEWGYGITRSDNRTQLAHRVAWEAANGTIPDGLLVCHHCDNPKCVNAQHLFLGTDKDNTQDMVRKGRQWMQVANATTRGRARHMAAKLTEANVLEIRELVQWGANIDALAGRFGVHHQSIRNIVHRTTWAHVA